MLRRRYSSPPVHPQLFTEPTLQDQIIKAGAKETTIVLDRDYTESITIGKDQNIILDLNGWTLTYDSNSWNSSYNIEQW